jgi:ABC-type multidrug transport system fused ATPase/permease subunit
VKNLKNTAEGMTEILPFAESYFRCLEMAKIVIPRIEEVEEPLEQIRSIELQSVSFSYDPPDTKPPEKKSTSATPTRRQLDNFTFTFEMGKVYSIIGKNGSGKSTLASILAKLNIPSEGKFLANGKDVKDISADIWLKQFGIMPQAFSHLSDFSVRDNIAFGSPALLERDIHNVVERQAKAFNVDTFTTLNTMFGDKTFSNQIPGTESESWTDDFSGGQWQSIALARTFCRSDSAHIFLLDEPSSALDPEREHGLFELLRRNKKERITIFISHSLRTCRASDCILVLERGKLVQSGSHAELIENEDGTYARLNRLQTDTWSNEEDSALE